jgi:hypothetical protein
MTNITLVTFLSKTLELLKLETLRPSSLFLLICKTVKITSSAFFFNARGPNQVQEDVRLPGSCDKKAKCPNHR